MDPYLLLENHFFLLLLLLEVPDTIENLFGGQRTASVVGASPQAHLTTHLSTRRPAMMIEVTLTNVASVPVLL